METRTRSGRISRPPVRYEPVEEVTDDIEEDGTVEDSEDLGDTDTDESEEDSDEESDDDSDADENGNLKDFIVDSDEDEEEEA